ncbi:MAG: PaaI family thioesterase [Planctomycetaceae bacterium]|jgi:acyl-CoA thioesterase|nr:PaaI family thioesterase [Planctomycetaceae bacterium]
MSLSDIISRFRADRYAMDVTGIEIVDAKADYAKVKLEVGDKHQNAVGIMQGGAVFTLADFAFAVASNNAAAEEEATVAIECHISFLKPVTSGTLYAEAKLESKSRSLATYDIPITNENGELVAKFHGRGFVRRKR